jgi:hypothetical protein
MFALVKPDLRACTRLLSIAAAARLSQLQQLLLHATAAALSCHCCLPCCACCCLPCCARCCSPCVQQEAAALGACTELCCSLLEFSPHTRGTCIWQGRKTKDTSRRVTCAAACLGYLSMCRRFWSHAKSSGLLGGTLGENVAWCSCHGSSTQADGCGLSPAAGPAWHVVFCGHLIVFSSLRGGKCLAPSHFFHEPSIRPDFPAAFVARWKMHSHISGVERTLREGCPGTMMVVLAACHQSSITVCRCW